MACSFCHSSWGSCCDDGLSWNDFQLNLPVTELISEFFPKFDKEYWAKKESQKTGVNAKVFTKGVSSINNQKEVLFILNGVQVGTFSQIVNILNPESIKSITVLKNANDIAIYGFRGSGGVILIKTK